MTRSHLALVLHSHLPFVRHPEHEEFLEENWFFEAITETYLPLIGAFERLADAGARFRITMSVTPTLAAMLADRLLQDRYLRRLERLIDLAEREVVRTRSDPDLQPLAQFYRGWFRETRRRYIDVYGRDLLGPLARLEARGALELITCAATHAFLPLLVDPKAIRAQILIGVAEHTRHFGRPPRGIWLPECGYTDGIDEILADAGLRFFFTDTHGVLHATPQPRYGVYAPIATRARVAAFGRDPEASRQVWSATEGYPGDPDYREFYRDIGFELEDSYLRPYLPPDGARVPLGIKYRRVTGKTEQKELYDPDRARARAEVHAADFLDKREQRAHALAPLLPDRAPLFVAPYDAELFGHWWFEGPIWLESLLRRAALPSSPVRLVTPSEYLDEEPNVQPAEPAASSWGDKGHGEVWLNQANDWIYPPLHAAARRMTELVQRHPAPSELVRRALAQAGRELLLAQSSDWAFILRAGTHVSYATRRTHEHLARFDRLSKDVSAGRIDEAWLADIEARDNVFPTLDPSVFA